MRVARGSLSFGERNGPFVADDVALMALVEKARRVSHSTKPARLTLSLVPAAMAIPSPTIADGGGALGALERNQSTPRSGSSFQAITPRIFPWCFKASFPIRHLDNQCGSTPTDAA
jgi:hypothetical protein